jgi:DNA-binding CsgD family transcriptional regulator
MLLGRPGEREVLDQLLDGARAGRSGIAVLRGEAGVGKTALLEYAIESASDLQVVRTAGVESEMELAFAALHQLCEPVLDRLARLPDPQRDALAVTFGLSDGVVPDRFFVGLAVLSLLSEAAEGRPLLCVVDDAQWLDKASAQALVFAARRLLAESVVMLFAAREPGEDLHGFPELVVEGLPESDARELLRLVVPGRLDWRVRDRVVAETHGNPLALIELTRGLSPAQLAGGFAPPRGLPLEARIEERFLRRLQDQPPDAQRLLLLAAAEPTGDAALLWRAANRLGIASSVSEPVQRAGLLEIGVRVRFRHPLVRSAIYRSAAPGQRRDAHRGLAEATDSRLDPDRRAWHFAQAAAGPDEEVAAELERSAGRAQARGGVAAAAAFLERAVALTDDPARRAERAFAAASASLQAGAFDVAIGLLAEAEVRPLDEFGRARAELLRARLAFAVNRGSDAPSLLLSAAKRLERLDVALARDTYLEALSAAQFAGRLAGGDEDVLAVAQGALSAPPPAGLARASDLLLDALARLIAHGYESGAPAVKQAVAAFSREDVPREEAVGWMWLACRTAVDVWDFDAWELLSQRMVDVARDLGALAALPLGLTLRIGAHLHAGEINALTSLVEEVDAINHATGSHLAPYGPVLLLAWSGRERDATALIDRTLHEVSRRGEGQGLAVAHCSRAVLFNGLGRYEEALAAASLAGAYPGDLAFRNWSLAELVEAAVRTGETRAAAEAVERLSKTTGPSATDWALGTEARCRALMSDGEAAEVLYRDAITRLRRSRVRVALARAHLLYGEWLRRERRRVDAREQLRIAHEMFRAMGMAAFAGRAERELLATGGHVHKRAVEMREELTAQEAQIARLARDGVPNAEIAARLFISRRTVEYHLSKVFTKLGISSRHELDRVLSPEPSAALAG